MPHFLRDEGLSAPHSVQLATSMISQILLLVHQHPHSSNQILGLEAPIFKVCPPRRLDFPIRVETYCTYLICNSHVAGDGNLELQT